MKVFATGKWRKDEKRWSMVVAIRRPGREVAVKKGDGRSAAEEPRRPR